MTNAELMNEEEKFLTAPQLDMLELIESCWMNGKKNNTLSVKASVMAGRIASKAPKISERLMELSKALV